MEHALRQLKFPAAKGGKYFGKHMQNWFLPLRLGHGGATLAFMNLPLEKKFKIWKNKLAFIRNSLRKRDSVGVLGSPAAAGRARGKWDQILNAFTVGKLHTSCWKTATGCGSCRGNQQRHGFGGPMAGPTSHSEEPSQELSQDPSQWIEAPHLHA